MGPPLKLSRCPRCALPRFCRVHPEGGVTKPLERAHAHEGGLAWSNLTQVEDLQPIALSYSGTKIPDHQHELNFLAQINGGILFVERISPAENHVLDTLVKAELWQKSQQLSSFVDVVDEVACFDSLVELWPC